MEEQNSIDPNTQELVNLLQEWDWGNHSIAIVLGLTKAPRENTQEKFLHWNRPGRVIQAINIALSHGWAVTKIASALAIVEDDLTEYLRWRENGDEVKRLLAACKDVQGKTVLQLLLHGFTMSEIVDLHWGDIDFKENLITVRSPQSK